MTGAWGRILEKYGQKVTVFKEGTEQGTACRAFLQPALERRGEGYQTLPTPLGLVRQVLRQVQIPVNVLIRPRFGDFCFTPSEKETTLWEIEQCRALGAGGVVLGALLPDGSLDTDFLARCIAASGGAEGRFFCTLKARGTEPGRR